MDNVKFNKINTMLEKKRLIVDKILSNGNIFQVYGRNVPLELGKDEILIIKRGMDQRETLVYQGLYTKEMKRALDEMLTIGDITGIDKYGEPIYERGTTEQGFVYKNMWAYLNHSDEVCYIPELSDDPYCYRDFMNICGYEKVADEVFSTVDWQSPEAYLNELQEDEDYYNHLIKDSRKEKTVDERSR